MNKTAKSNLTKRTFSWGVKTVDIEFMPPGKADAARDAAAGTNNCSATSEFVLRRKKAPRQGSGK